MIIRTTSLALLLLCVGIHAGEGFGKEETASSSSTTSFASSELPDEITIENEEWISLPDKVTQFLPSKSESLDVASSKRLRTAQERLLSGYVDQFADGDTYYDEYSQAWRMLGWYIDCQAVAEERRLNVQSRRLEEGGDDDAYSNNYGDVVEGNCRRYLLWAAYVDLDYQGGGIGEYQFFDAETGDWDSSNCELTESERCARMDCHLPGSHFKLLGFFKQYDYDDFMEQLFKHQAYCLWSSSQYSFMDSYREWWPQGCTQTGSSDGGTYIYADIQPVKGGDMTVGLYTDSSCTLPYTGRKVKAGDFLQYSGSNLDNHIAKWNEAFGIFKHCQPCKAYSLSSKKGNADDDDNVNGGLFQCNDDAGYTNVNQCMKFATKTDMEVASYRDVALASRQGGITRTYSADVRPSFWAEWGLLILSILLFFTGIFVFMWAARPPRVIQSKGALAPLVGK